MGGIGSFAYTSSTGTLNVLSNENNKVKFTLEATFIARHSKNNNDICRGWFHNAIITVSLNCYDKTNKLLGTVTPSNLNNKVIYDGWNCNCIDLSTGAPYGYDIPSAGKQYGYDSSNAIPVLRHPFAIRYLSDTGTTPRWAAVNRGNNNWSPGSKAISQVLSDPRVIQANKNGRAVTAEVIVPNGTAYFTVTLSTKCGQHSDFTGSYTFPQNSSDAPVVQGGSLLWKYRGGWSKTAKAYKKKSSAWDAAEAWVWQKIWEEVEVPDYDDEGNQTGSHIEWIDHGFDWDHLEKKGYGP